MARREIRVLPGVSKLPRLLQGGVAVCLGSGPSLTQDDVDVCRGQAAVIAINDSWRLAEWADVLYACDGKWWDHHKGVPSFQGLKFGLKTMPPGSRAKADKWPDVMRLKNAGPEGLSSAGLYTGSNSGYQAIQLAVHLGATRVLLLGYDMQRDKKGRAHWFGEHPREIRGTSDYSTFCNYFKSLVKPLKALGIEVVNCSRETRLSCFPRMTIQDALQAVAA